MGNQQTNFDEDYEFKYDETDSGFSEQNSPFEYNSNSLFNDLDATKELEKSLNPSLVTSTPGAVNNINKFKLSDITDSINEEDDANIAPPANLLQRRRSSVMRSKNIEIARSVGSITNHGILGDTDLEDTDDFDCEIQSSSFLSNKSNMSILSNSWSPNSNLPKTKIELVKSKSASEKTTPTKSYPLTNSFLSGMNFVGRVAKGVKDFYNEINPATLTGAIDVVVVKQEDGSYRCSPFHVRFGKLGVIRSKEKIVDIEINGQKVDDLHMVLGEAGEAFFIERINNSGEVELSTCSEFANCNLPPDTVASSTDSNSELSIKLVETSKLVMSKTETNGNKKRNTTVTLEKTTLNSESVIKNSDEPERQTMPIPISKSTPLIYENENECSSPLSPLLSPVSQNAIKEARSRSPKPTLNFFSDGDITPELTSPVYSRPSTPKSDTELEIAKFKRDNLSSSSATSDANQWNWSWGQFPERQNTKSVESDKNNNLCPVELSPTSLANQNSTLKSKDSSSSSSKILDGMLSLVSKNKNTPDGIYLDDTDKLDSEVADLYLNQKSRSKNSISSSNGQAPSIKVPTHLKDDDQESGKGHSLPQSPVNAQGPLLGDIQLSLCGFITQPIAQNSNTNSPQTNSSLSVSEVNCQPQSQSISPTGSTVTSSENLPNSGSIQTLDKENNSNSPNQIISTETGQNVVFDDLFQKHSVSFEKFMSEMNTIIANPNLVIKINNQYMNWQSAAPVILSALVFQRPLPSESIKSLMENNMPKQAVKQKESIDKKTSSGSGWGKNLFGGWGSKKSSESSTSEKTVVAASNSSPNNTVIDNDEYGVMFKEDWSKSTSVDAKNQNESTILAEAPKINVETQAESAPECKTFYKHRSSSISSSVDFNEFILKKELYRKSTRLSSSIIEKLNLKMGSNEIEYSITTALQGTTRITSYIFLWNYDDKIIVSDIDGTITKSDVWGQVLPIFGRDWSQDGVADLFTAIERNQYKFMYLSARAIGQSRITRDLLNNINQDGFTLPEGPLLVTPTSLFVAFQKEVIERKPEEFKISCLSDIKALFPSDNEVFYAGYGNKATDVVAYKAVGMPISRIFTINPQGEVKHEVSRTFQSSYSKLCDYVDLIFPPFRAQTKNAKIEYDTFNYWRDYHRLPEIDIEIEEELKKDSKENNKSSKSKPQSLNTSLQNTSNGQVNEMDVVKT